MIGYVYKIHNEDESIVYIGSTTKPLNVRWSGHKANYKLWLKGGVNCYAMIYHQFKEYGVDTFNISLIAEYEISCKTELREKEQYMIESNVCVNKNRAYLTHNNRLECYRNNYQNHIDDKKAKALARYYRNRESLKEKFDCDCGGKYTKAGRAYHFKTNKHQRWVANQQTN